MPDVAFGRGGWRAGAGDVMGIELLGKSFSCETLTECLLQGQEACWRWKWVVREAWVGWGRQGRGVNMEGKNDRYFGDWI